ncbi:ABC-ATPase domain-containing protein [bacterium]|nr:ABC-ATPase domain-containing protein [bacterium]
MLKSSVLKQKLSSIDGQDYGAYQTLIGTYDFNLFTLIIQQIPKDPFAPPHTGIYRIQVQRHVDRIINLELNSKIQKTAFTDFLARCFFNAGQKISKGIRGTGYSGIITIDQPGQAILERSSVVVTDEVIEVRCFLGLPADGRKIISEIAEEMLLSELPKIVDKSLLKENIDHEALHNHLAAAEDAEYLRNKLDSLELIAFIANNSILPRESGVSDKPTSDKNVVPFVSPDSLVKEIEIPHAGFIKGMAIPRGVTLITGGGYHGKSTLLKALETGIYNHIPGDGREQCVTAAQAVKIRAYDGRCVTKTDISPFIKNLPFGKNTTSFSTENASGSTSQAANIIEAIEVRANVLLMDEDTCATNFMIRDVKMQKLVNKADEPITAFIDKVKQLYLEKNISTVLVLGGVGDYFDVSDLVVQMINYRPFDVTAKARRISTAFPAKREVEDKSYPFHVRDRIPISESIVPHNEYGKLRIYAKEVHRLHFGSQDIDLTDLEQLMELSQTKALGYALAHSKKYMNDKSTLLEIIDRVIKDIDEHGIDVISDRISGHFAEFRGLELALALNRFRGFDVIQKNTNVI